MSRSSIFSFKTLDLRGNRWSRVLSALAVGLCLLAVAEVATRWLLRGVGRRWEFWHPEAAATFEAYRQRVSTASQADVVIVGDSTAHCNFDRRVLEQALGPGADVWNLAWDGNFADAFASSTLPLLAEAHVSPRMVVFSMTPAGFIQRSLRPSEAAILNCAYCRREKSRGLVEDWIYLARVLPALPVLVSDWRGDARREAFERKGFALKQGLLRDRVEGNFDEALPASAVVLDEQRTNVLARLAVWARSSGVRLIVVIPPTKDTAAWRESAYAAFSRLIQQKCEELGFEVVDGMRGREYPREYFADRNHLNECGARQFTWWLTDTILQHGRAITQNPETMPLSAALGITVIDADYPCD